MNGGSGAAWIVVAALAPLMILMLTSFVKVSVVLSLLRNAIGSPDAPSGLVVTGVSLILTIFVMAPVAMEMVEAAAARPARGGGAGPVSPPGSHAKSEIAERGAATGTSDRAPGAGGGAPGAGGGATGAGGAATRASSAATGTSGGVTGAGGAATRASSAAMGTSGGVTGAGGGATGAGGGATGAGATDAVAGAGASSAAAAARPATAPALEETLRALVPATFELEAALRALEPLRGFLRRHAGARDRESFVALAGRMGRGASGEELWVLAPAFLTTELREAFAIAVLIFIPFLVIDLVVGLGLAALGLASTSPQTVALPLKLLLFVAVDGWRLLIDSLLRGYV